MSQNMKNVLDKLTTYTLCSFLFLRQVPSYSHPRVQYTEQNTTSHPVEIRKKRQAGSRKLFYTIPTLFSTFGK